MVEDRTSYRNIVTRGLSVIALFAVCGLGVVGTSAVLLGTSSTAQAHGGGGHAAVAAMAAVEVADFMVVVSTSVLSVAAAWGSAFGDRDMTIPTATVVTMARKGPAIWSGVA